MVTGQSASDSHFAAFERHINVLEEMSQELNSAWQRYGNNSALELLAADLNRIQSMLGRITGEFLADDLLGEIFSRFCIGK